MIIVTVKKSSKGNRLKVKNNNGEIFNHWYNNKADAKRAWNNFVKQVLEGKYKFEE